MKAIGGRASESSRFAGRFDGDGKTFILALSPADLSRLGDLIRTNVSNHAETIVQIEDSVLKMIYGSENGEAEGDTEGSLVVRSNYPDLMKLADYLDCIANDDSGNPVHIHFDPIFLCSTGAVQDIVIERLD